MKKIVISFLALSFGFAMMIPAITHAQYAAGFFGGGIVSGGSTSVPVPVSTTPVGKVLGAESFHFTLLLKKGATGDEVTQLQTRLNADGATLTVDGKFGPKTLAALINWQKSHNLTADGIVGASTRAALNA